MKKMLVFSLMLVMAATTIAAHADDNLIYFQLGGTTTKLIVYNNTTDNAPIAVTIGGKRYSKLLMKGASWGRAYAFNYGTTLIEINVCTSVGESGPIPPPDWAMDPEYMGNLAITHEYLVALTQDPNSKKHLKDRVDHMKDVVKKRLGGNLRADDLNEWRKTVERFDLASGNLTCQNSQNILSVTDKSQWGWWDVNKVLEVVGSREKGYTYIFRQ